MDPVTFIFIGLITHARLTSGNTAILPNAYDHDARIYIVYRNGAQKGPFDIANKYIRVLDARNNNLQIDTTFTAGLPPLGEITGCTSESNFKQNIVQRFQTPDKAVKTYIDLHGGAFLVSSYYKDRIRFGGPSSWANYRCAACAAIWQAVPRDDADDTIRLVIANIDRSGETTYRLPAGTAVVVAHRPKQGTKTHFSHYYMLFDSDCSPFLKPEPETKDSITCGVSNERCDVGSAVGINSRQRRALDALVHALMPSVECTDTRWP